MKSQRVRSGLEIHPFPVITNGSIRSAKGSQEHCLQFLLLTCFHRLAAAESFQVSSEGSDPDCYPGWTGDVFCWKHVHTWTGFFYVKQTGFNQSYARKGSGAKYPRDTSFPFVTTFPPSETKPHGLHEPLGGGVESSPTLDKAKEMRLALGI